MVKIIIGLLFFLCPCISCAWTANVVFTPPNNQNYMTVALVSETSGDYTEGYGQRSEPGTSSVKIGGIKPLTQYYFSIYQVDPATWERSGLSPEVAYLTEAYVEQIVTELPPLSLGNTVVTFTVEMITK